MVLFPVPRGYLKEMQERGIEWLSVFSVDNVLQRINDPVYVGAVISSGCDCGGKVVRKASPDERVGVLCKESGKPAIVEYYEMTDDMRSLRDENGNLLYNFGVTLNYLFRLKRLEEIREKKLPVHIVEKKIPYIDEDGNEVKPEAPNGYKFEDLVLDMIHMMDSCLPYEIVREKEFAPVKNREGVDSVDTARELLTKTAFRSENPKNCSYCSAAERLQKPAARSAVFQQSFCRRQVFSVSSRLLFSRFAGGLLYLCLSRLQNHLFFLISFVNLHGKIRMASLHGNLKLSVFLHSRNRIYRISEKIRNFRRHPDAFLRLINPDRRVCTVVIIRTCLVLSHDKDGSFPHIQRHGEIIISSLIPSAAFLTLSGQQIGPRSSGR